MRLIECEQRLTNEVGFNQRIGHISWNYYSFREVTMVKGEDKTEEQLIKELRQRVYESYPHDLKTKPEEIKAYLEFFFYETK